jgi:hypothetical protein
MSAPELKVGCVFHWKQYEFDDGGKADKYFVLLGANAGSNLLAVIATSQQKKRSYTPGCHHEDGYFHIMGGKGDFFPEDTWLLLAPPVELSLSQFLKCAMVEKRIALVGDLRRDLANAIRNCLKRCLDVSEAQLALL